MVIYMTLFLVCDQKMKIKLTKCNGANRQSAFRSNRLLQFEAVKWPDGITRGTPAETSRG